MLIINISKIKILPKSLNGGKLIDVTNSTNYSQKIELNSIVNLDDLYLEALSEYKKFIVQLSQNQHLQTYKVKELQLYWLSDVAGKHPINHWGKNFFILLSLVKLSIEKINEFNQLVIILPAELKCVESNIDTLFKNYGCDIELGFNYTSLQSSQLSVLNVLKKSIKNLKAISNYKKLKSGSNLSENCFFVNSLDNQHTLNRQYYPLKDIFNKNGKELSIISILDWRKRKVADESMPSDYYASKPNIFQLLNIGFNIVKTYLSINNNAVKVEIDGVNFMFTNFSNDLRKNLLVKNDFIYTHFWLVNFFKKDIGNTSFIYEDEFYDFGKSISSAAKVVDPKIQTYGIQHGNFNEVHTVYTLTDAEIDAGFPMPSKFIVWGSYYQDIMQLNNTLPDSYFLPLGCPKYVNTYKSVKPTQQFNAVLWCLTTYECFTTEWNLIQNAQWLKHKQLIIRLHPLAHISIEQVNNILTNFNFVISSEPNIEDDFSRVDMVMTSAHSTVFLDAMAFKLPVIRLVTNRWVGSSNSCFGNYVFSNSQEVTDLKLEDISQFEPNDVNHEMRNLELDINNWNTFLTH